VIYIWDRFFGGEGMGLLLLLIIRLYVKDVPVFRKILFLSLERNFWKNFQNKKGQTSLLTN